MRILVVTHDLTKHNAHLMPWRTVCELVNRSRKKGIDSRLLSLGRRRGKLSGSGIPSDTISVSKEKPVLEQEMKSILKDWRCDVIVWPLVWREPHWRTKVISRLGIPLVGYLPGGVYQLSDTLYAAKRVGLRGALPYIAEAMWPKSLQLSRWKKLGFFQLIAMTDFTAAVALKGDWAGGVVKAIPPGRENTGQCLTGVALPSAFVEWRDERPFYLFAGPPSGIRGIYELLQSFERVAENNKDACLVCLFRSDAPLESERLRRVIGGMKCSERIYVIWESVERELFEAFISSCYGVVLPFVTVPSEIPLAIIEAMRFEKPIVTTMTGGTGEYVRKFGVSVALGDIQGLTESMLRLLSDGEYYKDRCEAAGSCYKVHPTWDDMVDEWLGCISSRISSTRGEER